MRHKSLDDILLAVFLLAAMVSLYMLYGQNLLSRDSDAQYAIASIADPLNTVKRKRDFYQGWVDVGQGDVLSPNDEVYTHGDSSAKIKFIQGPQINLAENSLLKIKSINGQAALSLEKGQLNAELSKSASQLKIEMGKKSYEFNSPDAKIQIEQTGSENKFSILDGAVKFSNGEKTLEASSDQVIVENQKSKNLEIKKLGYRQLFPADRTSYYFKDEKDISFSYRKINPVATGRLTVARDSLFQNIISEKELNQSGQENTVIISLKEEGSFYWRITDQNELAGPARKFDLIKETPFLLQSDRSRVYQQDLSQKSVLISWSAQSKLDRTKTFQLEITSSGSQPELMTTTGKNFSWKASHWGETTFRIRPFEQDRKDAFWSEPVAVVTEQEKSVQIKAYSTEETELVNYEAWPYLHQLEWEGPAEDFGYVITVSSNKNTAVKDQYESASPKFKIALKEPGTYNWSVQGRSPTGTMTNKISGKVKVKNPLSISSLPESGAIIELERPDQSVEFSWKKQTLNQYEFELSDDQNFRNVIIKEDISTNKMTTTVGKTGKYFWRVKVKGPQGVEYSRPVSVELKPTPPLEAPDKVPDLNLKIKYQSPSTSVIESFLRLLISEAHAEDPMAVAEWEVPANKRAREYIVLIYADQNKSQLIKRLVSTSPHIVWKEAIPGTFYWQVAYNDFWGRQTAFSELSKLIVENDPESEQNAYTTIELISPSHRAEVLKKADDEVQFVWDERLKKDYLFLLARDLDFSDLIVRRKVTENKFTLRCSDLKNEHGEFYWKVTSGKFISKRRMISAECEEPPPPPPPVPEQEIVKEETVVTTAVPAAQLSDHFWRLGLGPQKLTYNNKAGAYEASVDGQVINSFFADYSRPVELWGFSSFESALQLRRGKVFNTITFTDFDGQLALLRTFAGFKWGPVLHLSRSTLYVEKSLAISDQSVFLPMIGIAARAENQYFSGKALATAGKGMHAEAELNYKINEKIYAGPFFSMTNADEQGGEHKFTQVGLKVGAFFAL